jgi:hypothetical protein
MKKIAALTFLIIFLLMTVFACGSTKTCPAYSKNDTEQTNDQNG